MIIKSISIKKFRAFEDVSFVLGKRITAIAGMNATQKTTLLGMLGQPFTISKSHNMYGCKTLDGYNFRSQFKEKFKLSKKHDLIGSHKWTLYFYDNIYSSPSLSITSIPRKQKNKEPTLRFWNSESKGKNAGYVQLPVYYLSLSRLFPIGEIGKTHTRQVILSNDEKEYCVDRYREILSIQERSDEDETSIGLEQGTSSHTFAGISDSTHDIYTNSAGESNIMRILLAVLSFKRLQTQYPRDYKGGILLIDEIDATLYGYSQQKLVEYLYDAAGKYHIQIIFTTHSPLILKKVNEYQRKEYQNHGDKIPDYARTCTIVYLKPAYLSPNYKRQIYPQNISTAKQLNQLLAGLNLRIPVNSEKIRVYCEDSRACSFARYILTHALSGINLENYIEFVDVNLGWTNYVSMYNKKIPEFNNNIILLDADVLSMPNYSTWKESIEASKNIIILPLVIEKSFFEILKDHENFDKFLKYLNVSCFTYDICFSDWPLEISKYTSSDFKQWYQALEEVMLDKDTLFRYWFGEYNDQAMRFARKFVAAFNTLANSREIDTLPMSTMTHDTSNQSS